MKGIFHFHRCKRPVRRCYLDLRGQIIAFEDPGSTSGYFLPKLFLSRIGFKFSEKNGIEAQISPGDVGYVFAHSQKKLVDQVLTKQVAARAFSNDNYSALDEKKKSDITILAETERLPRHLLSIRTDMHAGVCRPPGADFAVDA